MIGFKNKEDVLPSSLILLAILLLAGSLAFMLLVPKPTMEGRAKGKVVSRQRIQKEIDDAKAASGRSETLAKTRLWSGRPEHVTAEVLAYATGLASKNNLKLGAFRPQRAQVLDGAAELPFSVQLSGSFPSMRAFLAALDTSGGKLALRSLQLAGADAASSAVTATIVVSAFVPADAVPQDAITKTKGATRGK